MRCPRCQSQNREGATFCEDCGARLELARPNCQRTGKRQEAQEHSSTAARMYREMDMRFWLEQAELRDSA